MRFHFCDAKTYVFAIRISHRNVYHLKPIKNNSIHVFQRQTFFGFTAQFSQLEKVSFSFTQPNGWINSLRVRLANVEGSLSLKRTMCETSVKSSEFLYFEVVRLISQINFENFVLLLRYAFWSLTFWLQYANS